MAWTTVGSIRGPQGPQGPAGKDGRGISIAGQVASYDQLPTDLTPQDTGKGYLVTDTGLLYIWTGNSFPIEGEGVEFRGEKGDQGPKGNQGAVGQAGPQGVKGDTGDRGPKGDQGEAGPAGPQGENGPAGPGGKKGDQGDKGDRGARGSLWHFGHGAPKAESVANALPGDIYLDQDDPAGAIYFLSED